APTVLDPMAVQRLKQRLVNEGYLDLTEAEVASPRWLPEYSYAAAQHSFDQLSKQFQGEKPGSISGEQILGLVDEWLSPRGLYKAAVELDLWWDWDKVKSDWGTWDARLKAWREDPWNIRKLVDLFDASAIDDLLFPALNLSSWARASVRSTVWPESCLGVSRALRLWPGCIGAPRGSGSSTRPRWRPMSLAFSSHRSCPPRSPIWAGPALPFRGAWMPGVSFPA